MISLLPMAGKGSRFKAEGYNLPKPFIPIMGVPMFFAAIQSFPKAQKYILICQQQFVERYPFQNKVQEHLDHFDIITVDGITEGQACTCLLAEEQLPDDEVLMISSCDYQLVYDHQKYSELHHDPTIECIIWTFKIGSVTKKNPEAFAYCRVDGNRVLEVVEKQVISDDPGNDHAVTGTFTYRRCEDFVWGAKQMMEKNIRVNNEFYVGTSINQLIEAGKKVVVFEIDKFISFGDPFELQLYQAWEEVFFDESNHPYQG